MTTVTILGVKISCLTPSNVQQWLTNLATQPPVNGPKVVFTPNPEIVVLAHRHPRFRSILNNADLLLPDGQGIVWASRGAIQQRITGVDTMFFLLDLAQKNKLSVGFILNPTGLTTTENLAQVMRQRYPKITLSPQPDILFVGLGAPQQENWVQHNKANLTKTKLILTVGGGIDFLTGQQRRAPVFFQTIGVEWLWRLWHQPQRLKRIITATIIFPLYHLLYD